MEKKKTYFTDGEAYVVSSSHNDIAFLDTPLVTILFRNKNVIGKAIEMIEEDPDFRHSMECSLYIKDFLILNPEMRDRLAKVLTEQKLQCGATYTQFYETSVTSEGLVRQYYLGKRWLEKEFPGFRTRTTWNQDVPARTMQSAQVMKKCGVDYLFVSRMNAGFFKWYSPDGSFVTGYTNGHYHCSSISEILGLSYKVYDESEHSGEAMMNQKGMNLDFDESGIDELYRFLQESAKSRYEERNVPPVYGLLAIRDYDYPLNVNPYMDKIQNNGKYEFPPMKHATADEFLDAALSKWLDRDEYFDHWRGERPNLWIYHLMTHADALTASRNGLNRIDEVEQLASFIHLYDKSFSYPQNEITNIWEKLLYLDHGWGGCNGHVTDETYRQVSHEGLDQAEDLKKGLIRKIESDVEVKNDGSRIFIYNPSQFARKDRVTCRINWKELGYLDFALYTEDGKEVPYQLVEEPSPWNVCILFTAEVPAYGYTALELRKGRGERKAGTAKVNVESYHKITVENDFYDLTLEDGGFTHIVDKELGFDIIDQNAHLKGFEVYELHSSGNGSGEFSEMQLPSLEYGLAQDKYGFSTCYQNTATIHNMHWRVLRHNGLYEPEGEIATIIVGDCRFPHFRLHQEIIIYNQIKKIDTKVEINAWDGTMYEEVRVNMPLNGEFSKLKYEVPMGILKHGEDEVQGVIGDKPFLHDDPKHHYIIEYPTDCREIHPREVQSWIACEGDRGVAMLACIDTPAFDWAHYIGREENPNFNIQPILFASRHSCFLDGGDPYEQIGDHHFRFSLVTGKGTLEENVKKIEGEKCALTPTVFYNEKKREGLPTTHSFLSVEGETRVSGIKKAEDNENIVVRLYETFGREENVKVSFNQTPAKVMKTDMLEYHPETLSEKKDLEDTVKPYNIETYMLEF